MSSRDIEAFENYLQAMDEHYDEGSTIIQEADVFTETDRKVFNKVKGSDYGKGSNNIGIMVVRYQCRNCYQPGERLNFFSCILFSSFTR